VMHKLPHMSAPLINTMILTRSLAVTRTSTQTQGPLGIANDPNKAPSANSTHTSNLSDVDLRLSKSGKPRPTRQLHTSLTAHLADRTGVSGFRGRMRALPHNIAAQLAKGQKQLKRMHKL
jgi:hypothetical protein